MVVNWTCHVCAFNDGKWPPWPCESEKETITRERKIFSEICVLKTFGVQRRLRWYVQFVAHTSYASARLGNTQRQWRDRNLLRSAFSSDDLYLLDPLWTCGCQVGYLQFQEMRLLGELAHPLFFLRIHLKWPLLDLFPRACARREEGLDYTALLLLMHVRLSS